MSMVGTWVLGNDLNTIYCYQDECDVDKVYPDPEKRKALLSLNPALFPDSLALIISFSRPPAFPSSTVPFELCPSELFLSINFSSSMAFSFSFCKMRK